MVDYINQATSSLDIHAGTNKTMALALAGVGAYYMASFALRFTSGFLKYCILPRRDLRSRYGGGYALITGASDGLGKEYARNLAKSGFDVVLMARDKAKLDKVAKEIR